MKESPILRFINTRLISYGLRTCSIARFLITNAFPLNIGILSIEILRGSFHMAVSQCVPVLFMSAIPNSVFSITGCP